MPAIEGCDVVIDFSAADATAESLRSRARSIKKPLVLGTTGHNAAQKESVAAAARVSSNCFRGEFQRRREHALRPYPPEPRNC